MNESAEVDNTSDLIQRYFSLGFQQKKILQYLKILHGKIISISTLKRYLSKLRLYRRSNYSKLQDVAHFIDSELNKSAQLHGYKWMHLRCLQHNLVVTQQVVRDLLSLLDPTGVQIRRKRRLRRRQYNNKGPNYLWHVDSYDKLKPYGICLNGCIDGFSRNIIGGYFFNAIKLIGGSPQTIRSDMGTENGTMEHIQKALHDLFRESPTHRPSFLYGKSVHNQRIEAWWSILRKQNSQYWMNLFQMFKEDDLFDGSFLDTALIQFCFLDLIQKELDEVSLEWNLHRIRKTKNAISPAGRPVIMYEMPSLYGTSSYIIKVPYFATDSLLSDSSIIGTPKDQDFDDLCCIIMEENNLSRSSDPYTTVDLYVNLRRRLLTL